MKLRELRFEGGGFPPNVCGEEIFFFLKKKELVAQFTK